LFTNWDNYVGVSFLFRADPTMTAKDLGYLYLPQEVVTKESFDAYAANLQPISLDEGNSFDEIQGEECAGGACPIK
jgi:ribonucleoside-triphosphate reductase